LGSERRRKRNDSVKMERALLESGAITEENLSKLVGALDKAVEIGLCPRHSHPGPDTSGLIEIKMRWGDEGMFCAPFWKSEQPEFGD
jgi:hypothetical protein